MESQYWGAHLRFFGSLCVAYKVCIGIVKVKSLIHVYIRVRVKISNV
eukprot:COSAG05_NODE_883_length_6777_cov_36.660081_4_plen_47_part_00